MLFDKATSGLQGNQSEGYENHFISNDSGSHSIQPEMVKSGLTESSLIPEEGISYVSKSQPTKRTFQSEPLKLSTPKSDATKREVVRSVVRRCSRVTSINLKIICTSMQILNSFSQRY